MPTYQYKASTMDGKTKRGTIEANDEHQLRDVLSHDNLILMSFKSDSDENTVIKMKTAEIAELCRQLSAMLSAGVPLVRAVSILLNRDLPARLRKIYTELYGSLQRGKTLSEAMELQGGFPPLLVNAFRASEASGHMDKTSREMAIHYEAEHRLKGKITSAAFYPLFLLFLTLIIMVAIFKFILPQFFVLFEGMVLPPITQFVIGISNVLTKYGGLILIGIMILILAGSFVFRIPSVKCAYDHFKLKIPFVGKLLRTIYTSRFARTLSSLYSSGLTIVNALQSTKNTLGNTYIASQFDGMIGEIRNGSSLSSAVAKIDGFDSKLASTINIGEESGNLDYMLTTMSDSFDYESEQAMNKLTSLIEPILIIVMAILIGFIMISVMLPILSLYDNIGAGAL
ncbi:MAG: type II secretion system F family protein [Oscillospiraceae bacterium]